MKRCNYCGKENEDTSKACCGCGTPLPVTPASPEEIRAQIPPVINPPQPLNGLRATLIFFLVFVSQVIGAAIVTAILIVVTRPSRADLQSLQNYRSVSEFNKSIEPAAVISAGIFSALATLGASFLLVRRNLWDTSPTGAAWVLGAEKDLAKGFGFGLALGIGCSLVTLLLDSAMSSSKIANPKFGPLTTMALTPGLPQFVWIVLAIALAPAPEELLFRGVMYGGYRHSLGPGKAAFVTTGVFVLMHITEWSHYLPAVIGITGLALLALHMRLRSAAIGPCVAVHVGYNFIAALNCVLYTALR